MTDKELLQAIYNDTQELKRQVSVIEDKTSVIENRVSIIEDKTSVIENKVTGIELTLENEIRTNIKRVAEGHLDLSRNLHEALKIDNEKEMLSIRVNILETELRKVKERLDRIA